MYLTVAIDLHIRHVISWGTSNSLEQSYSIETLQESLKSGKPEIFNTDNGSQFPSPEFTSVLKSRDILIRMEGRGRALDNIFIE